MPDPAEPSAPTTVTSLPAADPSAAGPSLSADTLAYPSAEPPQLGGKPTPPAGQPAAPPGYVIEKELGRGGMGVVYLARQVKLNRPVALKMILSGGHAGATDRERFLREAEAIARMQHPNIVQVFETGEHDGLPYFSLEFCPGGSLDKKLAGTPLKPAEAAALAATLARAVQYAHDQGIVHRDLKPHNVLLLRDGTPKIMDFGLAKKLDADSSTTRTGTIMGTPSYMAPEQARGEVREVGPPSDVYALGAMLYEFLTGRPPFRAATAMDTVLQVLNQEPVPPGRVQPATPRDLETICLKCLEKDPRRRYPSAAAVADDLERFLRGEPITARPVGRAERVWRWGRRHPVAAGSILTALALAAVLVAGLVSVAQSRQKQVREFALRKNAADARHVASTVLLRLQAIGGCVERAAEDSRLPARLKAGDRPGLRAYCKELAGREDVERALRGDGDDPVASWMVLDPDGRILAVSHDEGVKNPNVAGRDYYHGALAARRAAGRPAPHVSRCYHSQNQRLPKFAVSVAVEDGGKVLGVLVVTLATGATLGSKLFDGDQEVALALPTDPTPPAGPPPAGRPPAPYLLVVHPAYRHGQEPVELPAGLLPRLDPDPARELELPREESRPPATDDYSDPAGAADPRFAGRWLAGFAPVGNTEVVVIVQQSHDHLLDPDRAVLRQLAGWSGAALAVGLLATAGLVLVRTRARPAG